MFRKPIADHKVLATLRFLSVRRPVVGLRGFAKVAEGNKTKHFRFMPADDSKGRTEIGQTPTALAVTDDTFGGLAGTA